MMRVIREWLRFFYESAREMNDRRCDACGETWMSCPETHHAPDCPNPVSWR